MRAGAHLRTTGDMSSHPVFLLGAGFNRDASNEVECVDGARYPLLSDIPRLVGLPDSLSQSIEQTLADRIKEGDDEPIKSLAFELDRADHYIAPTLARTENCYSRFFKKFAESDYVTFNYDSLPETILFASKDWSPDDGFGIPVTTALGFAAEPSSQRPPSKSHVLHLHGSLSLYTIDFDIDWSSDPECGLIRDRKQPVYAFDPGPNLRSFPGYDHLVTIGFSPSTADRIVAPVPEKARLLQEPFIEATYRKACGLVQKSCGLVAIGYSFGEHDLQSYYPLVEALRRSPHSRLLVVCPDAEDIAIQLRKNFPSLRIDSRTSGFAHWVMDEYPGLA